MVSGKVLDTNEYNWGFDAQAGEFKDLLKAGIIDPTKVVRSALQHAAVNQRRNGTPPGNQLDPIELTVKSDVLVGSPLDADRRGPGPRGERNSC